MKLWPAMLMLAGLANPALAKPTCAEQLTAYDKWLAPIKADVAKGAVMSDHVERFVALPLRTGTPPQQSAMTIVVDKDGLHDGSGPAKPASGAAALIEGNRNISWARSTKNAISHGILVAATPDAPAASVKAAVVAAAAAKEAVWLVFRPSDGTAAAPASSAVSKEIDKLDVTDINPFVTLIQREFGTCDGLMKMMRKLSGQTESSRLKTLVDAPRPALDACKCRTQPDVAASILWRLGFANLAVVVPVPAKSIAGLPWGDAKATWNDVGQAVAAAIKP